MRMISHIDAAAARRWFNLALGALAAARPQVDALNVFPVQDSDTGTNVVLTLSAGARAAQRIGEDAPLGELAAAMADGALWGARGNSGVILAQALQAMSRTFEGRDRAGPVELIRAFDAVSQAARSALATPVEGTIITVTRAVAGAVLGLGPRVTLQQVVETALLAGYRALDETTDQLDALRGSGMVDAGALCYVILLEALATTTGVPLPPHADWLSGSAAAPTDHGPLEGYEVMYVVRASHRQATSLRMHLSGVGNSVVVVQGKTDLWHVHVHLEHPARALSELEMSQVCVRRLDAPRRPVGIVAATSAPHLLEPLAGAGAVAVLGAEPHTFTRAIIDTGAQQVIVLPGSAHAAAGAAAAGSDPVVQAEGITVAVASTADDLAVYEAVSVLGAAADWDIAAQLDAVRDVVASSTTIRVENADMRTLEAEVDAIAARLAAARPGVVSVLVGASVGARRAATHLTALLRAAVPEVETFVLAGGQPDPALIVTAQ